MWKSIAAWWTKHVMGDLDQWNQNERALLADNAAILIKEIARLKLVTELKSVRERQLRMGY